MISFSPINTPDTTATSGKQARQRQTSNR